MFSTLLAAILHLQLAVGLTAAQAAAYPPYPIINTTINPNNTAASLDVLNPQNTTTPNTTTTNTNTTLPMPACPTNTVYPAELRHMNSLYPD
jgi:hypothetical protein